MVGKKLGLVESSEYAEYIGEIVKALSGVYVLHCCVG